MKKIILAGCKIFAVLIVIIFFVGLMVLSRKNKESRFLNRWCKVGTGIMFFITKKIVLLSLKDEALKERME